MSWKTTEAYVSGGICGHMWMPDAMAGTTIKKGLRAEMSRIVGDTPNTFRDVLDLILCENGGDFQDARYTADTEVVVIRKRTVSAGKYEVHVKRLELGAINCADLVREECYTNDFMGEDY